MQQKSLPLYQYWYNYLHRQPPTSHQINQGLLTQIQQNNITAFFRVNLCHITILTMVLLETVKFQTIASRNNNNKTINETHLHSWYWDLRVLVLNLNWGSTQMLKLLFPAIKCSTAIFLGLTIKPTSIEHIFVSFKMH